MEHTSVTVKTISAKQCGLAEKTQKRILIACGLIRQKKRLKKVLTKPKKYDNI
jgi:hypothetical protein